MSLWLSTRTVSITFNSSLVVAVVIAVMSELWPLLVCEGSAGPSHTRQSSLFFVIYYGLFPSLNSFSPLSSSSATVINTPCLRQYLVKDSVIDCANTPCSCFVGPCAPSDIESQSNETEVRFLPPVCIVSSNSSKCNPVCLDGMGVICNLLSRCSQVLAFCFHGGCRSNSQTCRLSSTCVCL